MKSYRHSPSWLSWLLALATLATSPLTAAQGISITAEQGQRIRTEKVPKAIALIPPTYRFVEAGTLTVGVSASSVLPFTAKAADNRTLVGCDPELAQLIADSLGLKLRLEDVSWADWPLAVASGRFDAALANVTVTEERKKKFDFSTWRIDVLGFYVKPGSRIRKIEAPADISGLKVAVDPATNQEQILLRWNNQDKAAGLKPAELLYYDDPAVRRLALEAGRIDAYFAPNAELAYEASRSHRMQLVGLVSGGWPRPAEISVVTRKGAGLADAITFAINSQIENGNYAKVLARWSLTAEAIKVSRTDPPGLPAE
jgi:polar amino acid transport system substrate-binding protein